MNPYELLSPKTGKPCGVFACGVCNLVTSEDLAIRCCAPCSCGKPSRNRFEGRCSGCANVDYQQRRARQLEEAELVDWDGSMIFSEEVSGYRDGWFNSPEDLADHCADEGNECPEFAFLGLKCVKELNLYSAIERMEEDTYEDAEVGATKADFAELQAAVDKFNQKYAITYYEHQYSKKVRVRQ